MVFEIIRRRSLISGAWASSKAMKGGPVVALDSINLCIERGKKIGIIGRNGAGKTTLMRLLAGIYSPTKGTIEVNSKSVSLLTLGVGFDVNATGLDNIYLGSMLNGMTLKQVEKIVDSVIEFSDLGDHIYYPVKTYSSGMRARLSFSIAIHGNPEVLLLDEILSVGDFEFQNKSKKRMQEFINSGNKTVVISSHSMETIKDICDEVIWLDNGSIKGRGDPKEIINAYSQSKKAK
jgi:ABC-type polysaccharide/polyol phosphate transport system ATPase subunit